MEILNMTPFPGDRMVYLDKRAAERLVVVLKGTYSISDKGEVAVAGEQDPIRAADEFHGEPDASSIRDEAELGPAKPATDVFLRGSARAPRAGTTAVDVRFRVGPVARAARVFGERTWEKALGVATVGAPKPFDAIPLIYENAYGGKDLSADDPKDHGWEPRNPVGRGFRAKRSRAPLEGSLLPHIEDPRQPIGKPGQEVAPAGFGPAGRHWEPRVRYAGTYDTKWLEERMPLLPLDFDERFHNAAPPGLVAPGRLRGGEPVEVAGCTRSGKLAFRLPKVEPWAVVRTCDRVEELRLDCDTVTVDTDRMALRLVWKGELAIHREVLKLREIVFRFQGEGP